jgi:hypothetical protein
MVLFLSIVAVLNIKRNPWITPGIIIAVKSDPYSTAAVMTLYNPFEIDFLLISKRNVLAVRPALSPAKFAVSILHIYIYYTFIEKNSLALLQ